MKKVLLAGAAVAALASGAQAADLGVPRQPVAAVVVMPAFSWTGFYVGLQAGHSWGNHRISRLDAAGNVRTFGGVPLSDASSMNGFVGGAHIGYNYQINQVVLGVEADLEGSTARYRLGNVAAAPGFDFNYGSVGWQGSLRARLGLVAGNALFYLTGGLALADIRSRVDVAGAGALFIAYSKVQPGWTLGGGVEYAFTPNWTARAEYRYTNLGSHSVPSPGGTTVTFRTSDVRSHTVRLGVSYLFSTGPSAVVARY